MRKSLKQNSKVPERGRRSPANPELHIGVKVGILQTIADAIYPSSAGKIREAVANAQDNGASWIVISANSNAGTLSLYDNGSGISPKRFQDIFSSIGAALLNRGNETLSFFGLGMISVFRLGPSISIFSHPRGQRNTYRVTINTAPFFDPENKDSDLSMLDQYLAQGIAGPFDRGSLTAPSMEPTLEGEPFGGTPASFTEIVIEDMRQEDIDAICTKEFEDELRKLLPLAPDRNDPFLSRIKSHEKRKKILDLLESPVYCPSIDVYLGVDGELPHRLFKYFPTFKSDMTFTSDQVEIGESKDEERSFAYYLLYSIAEDFYHENDPRREEGRETGLYVRNRNYDVKGPHFLERPGPGRKLISQPLRNWLFGEVFHKDMNRFLTVARNDYRYDNADFKTFRTAVIDLVKHLNQALRGMWTQRDKVKTSFILPFDKFASSEGTLPKMERALKGMLPPDLTEAEQNKRLSEYLIRLRRPKIEDSSRRIDHILTRAGKPLPLYEDDKVTVKVDPTIPDLDESFKTGWDAKTAKLVISVSPVLFQPRSITFLGSAYEVLFVAQGSKDDSISFNLDKNQIFVNPFNGTLTNYSVSALDLIVAIDLADAISIDKATLKQSLLTLLGLREVDCKKFILPLGDGIRRALAYQR